MAKSTENVPHVGNPDDEVRDAVLRHLYKIHKKAKSPKSAAIGMRDLASALKPHGYKQQDVAHNLDYLLQKKWVVEVVENRAFTTAGGTVRTNEKRTYKISDLGIDLLESASTYKKPPVDPYINITSIQGVTVVGDGNLVNTSYAQIPPLLAQIRQGIVESDKLSDGEKLSVLSDIDTLNSQLQKPSPDRTIVQRAWHIIQNAASLTGVIDLVQKAQALLGPLLM